MPRSRTGCLKCKRRRIKCDETHPVCTNCTRLGEPDGCHYAAASPGAHARAQARSSAAVFAEDAALEASMARSREVSTTSQSSAGRQVQKTLVLRLLQQYASPLQSTSHPSLSPSTAVRPSASGNDPFDVLPVQNPGTRALELLAGYFLRPTDPKRLPRSGPNDPSSSLYSRHQCDLPFIMETKASFCALVAFLEIDDLLGGQTMLQTSLYQANVDIAISELRHALANPGYMGVEDMIHTVTHLSWTEHLLGKWSAAAVHIDGLAVLASQHFPVWWKHPKIRNGDFAHFDQLSMQRQSVPSPQHRMPKEIMLASRMSPVPEYLVPLEVAAGLDHRHRVPDAIVRLVEQQMLSVELVPHVRRLVGLQGLLGFAHMNPASYTQDMARETIRHLLFDAWSLQYLRPATPIDVFWQACLTLYHFRMAYSRPDVIAQRLATLIQQLCAGVHNIADNGSPQPSGAPDIVNSAGVSATLARSHVSALLWTALLAGPVAHDNLRPWYVSLLQTAVAGSNAPTLDFDSALRSHIHDEWLWCDRLDDDARQFWNQAMGVDAESVALQWMYDER